MSAGWSFTPDDIDHECPVIRRVQQIRVTPGSQLDTRPYTQFAYRLRTAATIEVPQGMADHLPYNPHVPGSENIFGWLEMPSSVHELEEGLYQVSEEWHYRQVPRKIYGEFV
jgi:hypothetical protein